jgi:DMSO reductase family type II enzyme chaperone
LVYPVPELAEEMRNGNYGRAVAEAHELAFACSVALPRIEADFTNWEAEYAEFFDVGAKGKPAVSLCAGDDEEILDGRERPEFLIEFVRWYSHFGLKLRLEAEMRELPDHVTCQLEFMAWLAHLEGGAEPGSEIALGYRQAQLDFCGRCLDPFVMRLAAAAGREVERRGCGRFFAALLEVAVGAVHRTEREMETSSQSYQQAEPNSSNAPSSVSTLWGD